LTTKIYKKGMRQAGSVIFGKRQWYQDVARGCGGRLGPSLATATGLSLTALLWLALAGAAAPAAAQQTSSPSGFDPRQTERQFDARRSEQWRISHSAVRLPRVDRTEAPADSSKLIDLRAVSVAGAHTLPAEQIAGIYQPFLGKKVSQADLVAIAAGISDLYRAAGYHLSRAIVPPQDVAGGRLRITVIEGSISEVALKGDGAERFGVRPMLNAVLTERPARLATLERQLLLINDRPGVRIVDTALEEIGVATGNFRLIVFLKTWQVHTSFGLDNLGSSAVGPWQSYAAAAFNSYLTQGDALVVNLSTIPADPRELAFGRLAYDAPVGTDGARLGVSALYSDVRPGDDRSLYNTHIRTDSYEIKGSIVPLQSQQSTLTLTAAAGFSDVSESDLGGAIYNDHIRTVSMTADYRLQDPFGGKNYLTLTGRRGLDILGASHIDDDLLSRDGASGQFSVLDLWFTRYQTLSDAWSVKIAAASQSASTKLLTSQQFYLGGAAFGRGYGSAEISGDNGVAGSLELRFDQSLNQTYLQGYQLYGFADSGAAWNVGYGLADGLSLTSVGAGVRFHLVGDLRADIGVAVPLSYRAPDNQSRSARLLFSLSNAFRLCPGNAPTGCL
jgi:hemolysin activation/secretion protein